MPGTGKDGASVYTTPSDTEVQVVRIVRAPLALAFDMWTLPEHISRWMLGPEGWTMPVCEIDLRPGGAWRYVWRKADGKEMEMTGRVLEVVRPTRLVTTERWGPAWPESTNTVVLTESNGLTTMTLTMTYESKAVRDRALGTGMTGGMDVSFDRMDALLAALA